MSSKKNRMSLKKQNRCVKLLAKMNRRTRELTPEEAKLIRQFLHLRLNIQGKPIRHIERETGKGWGTIRKLIEDLDVNYSNVIDLGPDTATPDLLKALRHMNLNQHRLTPRTLNRIKKLLIELHVKQDLWITEMARRTHVNEALLRGLVKKTLGTTKTTIDMKGNETTQKVLQIVSKLNLQRHTLTPRARRTLRHKLHQLHLTQGISTRRIAKMTGKVKTSIGRLFRRWHIPIRENLESLALANRKGPKAPFAGTIEEEAQMVGLILGDITVRRHHRLVAASLTTTHPAMIKLFIDTFGEYASIHKRPYYDQHTHTYKYRLWASLHPSFTFLLNVRKNVFQYIATSSQSFLRLLASFTDADGSIMIKRGWRNHVTLLIRWGNTDKQLLDAIRAQLERMNFNPYMCIGKRRGYKTSYGITRKDFWELAICRKQEVPRLLQILPVRHAEKVAKKRLSLKTLSKHLTWPDAEQEILALRRRIQGEVLKCKAEAQQEYKQRTHRNQSTTSGMKFSRSTPYGCKPQT